MEMSQSTTRQRLNVKKKKQKQTILLMFFLNFHFLNYNFDQFNNNSYLLNVKKKKNVSLYLDRWGMGGCLCKFFLKIFFFFIFMFKRKNVNDDVADQQLFFFN